MDPLYFEKVTARNAYKKMVLFPSVAFLLVLFIVIINLKLDPLLTSVIIIFFTLISMICFRQRWIKYVRINAKDHHQFLRIIKGEKIKSNVLIKTDIFKYADNLLRNKDNKLKINTDLQKNVSTNTASEVKSIILKTDLLYYEVIVIITSIIIIMTLYYIGYHWFANNEFNVTSLVFLIIPLLVMFFYLDQVMYKGIYFSITDEGITSRVDGIILWHDVDNISIEKSYKNENFTVNLNYESGHYKRIISLTNYSDEEINKIEYLINKYFLSKS